MSKPIPPYLRLVKSEPEANRAAKAAKVFGLIALGLFLLALFSNGCSKPVEPSKPSGPSVAEILACQKERCVPEEHECMMKLRGAHDDAYAVQLCTAIRALCNQDCRDWMVR